MQRRVAATVLCLLAWGSLPALAQKPGDRVIVRRTGSGAMVYYTQSAWWMEFREAEVISAAGGQVKVKLHQEEPLEEEVLAQNVTAPPDPDALPRLAVGDLVLLKSEDTWIVRKVQSVSGPDGMLADERGEAQQAGWDSVLEIPAPWRPRVARWWTEEQELIAALEAAKARTPAGMGGPLKPGDTCIYDQGEDSWTEGEVRSVDGGKCTLLQWNEVTADRGEVQAETARVAACPEKAFPVKAGDVVLARFRYFANHRPWVRALVVQVRGVDVFVATDHPGATLDLTPGDYLPLQPK